MADPRVLLLFLPPLRPLLGDVKSLPIKELTEMALPPILYLRVLD